MISWFHPASFTSAKGHTYLNAICDVSPQTTPSPPTQVVLRSLFGGEGRKWNVRAAIFWPSAIQVMN